MTNSVTNNAPLPAFSSSTVNVLQIIEENTKPGTPPTSQVYAVEVLESDSRWHNRKALLSYREGATRMVILKNGFHKNYKPQNEEIERELTPDLVDEFTTVSNERLPFTEQDQEAYDQVHDAHQEPLFAPGITKISAADAKKLTFENEFLVHSGDIVAHSMFYDEPAVLRANRILSGIVCGATARINEEEGVIGLGYYDGAKTPEEFLQELMNKMLTQNAPPEAIEFQLAGGDIAPHATTDGHNLKYVKEFLELRGKFPIVAARVNNVEVACNSAGETIMRNTDDDHNSEINVAQTKDGMLISHVSFPKAAS